MTTGHLRVSVRAVATMREMKSVPPPGVKGTNSLMGLLGKSCALRVAEKRQNIVTNRDLDSKEIFFILQLLFSRFSKGITGQSIDALKSIIQEDPSFNVVSAAMTRLADLDSIEVMNFARSLEKQNINGLNVAIADVYSRFGEVQDYQFLENLNLNWSPEA